jgi:hypothetical protein
MGESPAAPFSFSDCQPVSLTDSSILPLTNWHQLLRSSALLKSARFRHMSMGMARLVVPSVRTAQSSSERMSARMDSMPGCGNDNSVCPMPQAASLRR